MLQPPIEKYSLSFYPFNLMMFFIKINISTNKKFLSLDIEKPKDFCRLTITKR